MKRTISVLAVAALVLALFAGCGKTEGGKAASSSSAGASPKEVTFLCPSAAGGAMDANSRLIAPYIQKHLGKPVNVVNMGGSAGWVGWKHLHDAPRDGSMLSYANFPNMINGYLDPKNTVGLDKSNFEFLALYTSDINVVAANAKEKRYSNAKEFFDYARKNLVTVADAGARTDDAVAVALLEKALGFKFKRVHFQNSAEGLAALYGGHVDAWVGNVSEVLAPSKNGEMKVLAVLDKKRSEYLPNVQTAHEVGVEVVNSSSRGIIAAKGLDPTEKEKIMQAIKKAMEDPEQLAAAEKQGVGVTPLYGADFEAWVNEQDKNIRGIFDLLD